MAGIAEGVSNIVNEKYSENKNLFPGEVNLIKDILRREILAKRGAMTKAEVDSKSESIHKQLFMVKYFQEASTIMAYVDFRNEVTTEAIITQALALGKRVCIPVCSKEGCLITPSEVRHFPQDLQCGTWGILEPKPDCMRPVDPSEIDLVLVPGVAFDYRGNRLGYGAGYYDRFLQKTNPQAIFIALAFQLQVVDNAFPAPHDIPLHYILTEEKLISCHSKDQKGGKM